MFRSLWLQLLWPSWSSRYSHNISPIYKEENRMLHLQLDTLLLSALTNFAPVVGSHIKVIFSSLFQEQFWSEVNFSCETFDRWSSTWILPVYRCMQVQNYTYLTKKVFELLSWVIYLMLQRIFSVERCTLTDLTTRTLK